MIRVLTGVRLAIHSIGLCASAAGAVMALGYLSLRFPSTRKLFSDPSLRDVVYEVPHWLLGVGVVVLSVGIICTVLSWLTSPRWSEGPYDGHWFLTGAAPLATGWLTAVVVAVLGRDSDEVGLWVVCIVVAPILIVAGLVWMWVRA